MLFVKQFQFALPSPIIHNAQTTTNKYVQTLWSGVTLLQLLDHQCHLTLPVNALRRHFQCWLLISKSCYSFVN